MTGADSIRRSRWLGAVLIVAVAAALWWVWAGGGIAMTSVAATAMTGTQGSTTSTTPQSAGAQRATARPTTTSGPPPARRAADAQGQPVDSAPSAQELSTVSQGGGYGPSAPHDWNVMGPNEVSSPEMNLVIPWVPAGLIHKASGSAVDVPVSFQSGWVTTTSPVGSRTGPTVIVGHVNYADGSWAPMSNIHYAEPGMAIRVSDGAGGIETFTVASRTVVEQTRISDLVAFTTTGPRQLILITCGGPLENGIYTHNEVVVATPAVTR